ncbi:hypothetical protein [Salipiger mucosus]|nr:hypothetical protein [Salipiger mucosus]
MEPRKADGEIDHVLFFGLQMELAKLAGSAVSRTW